jgi:hypothetical protein
MRASSASGFLGKSSSALEDGKGFSRTVGASVIQN